MSHLTLAVSNDSIPPIEECPQLWDILYGWQAHYLAPRFIEALTGDVNTPVFWQTFEETKSLGKAPILSKNAHYSEVSDTCQQRNEQGHGIFIAINQIQGPSRKQKNVVKFNAAFMDIDGKDNNVPLNKLLLPVKPTIISARDLTHYHIFFALKGVVTLEQWTALQRCLIRRYHADKAMVDSARVMRVPGYLHLKKPDTETKYNLIVCDKAVRYTFDELAKALEVNEEDYKPGYEAGNKNIDYKENQAIQVSNFIAACQKMPPAISDENGNDQTYRVAAKGVQEGLSKGVILGIMNKMYNRRCQPPWDYSALNEFVEHAWQYAQDKGGSTPEVVLADVPMPTDMPKKINAVDLLAFAKTKLPERERIIDPWLPAKGLAMIYAERGVGKTYLALNIAYAVACGGIDRKFLNWSIPKPRNVLYIDGEMPAEDLQNRVQNIISLYPDPKAKIKLVAHDLLQDITLNIARPEDQKLLEPCLEGMELVVVDNISTLCAVGKENEAESWSAIQEWALRQRRAGRTVLFVHHANKAGGQRGTSRRGDVMDTIIKLEHPKDYEPNQGAVFELHFEKNRGFCGEKAKPIVMELKIEPDFIDNDDVELKQGWLVKPLELTSKEKVLSLKQEGLNTKDIAKEVGLSYQAVWKIIKQHNDENPSANAEI